VLVADPRGVRAGSEEVFERVPGPMRDRLVAAVVAGEKVATSSLLLQYADEGEPLPTAGERRVVIDSSGEEVAVVELLSVIRLGDADQQDSQRQRQGREGQRRIGDREGPPRQRGSVSRDGRVRRIGVTGA
jgi:uncharacterized protein YhfF